MNWKIGQKLVCIKDCTDMSPRCTDAKPIKKGEFIHYDGFEKTKNGIVYIGYMESVYDCAIKSHFIPVEELTTDFTALHQIVEERPDIIVTPQPEHA